MSNFLAELDLGEIGKKKVFDGFDFSYPNEYGRYRTRIEILQEPMGGSHYEAKLPLSKSYRGAKVQLNINEFYRAYSGEGDFVFLNFQVLVSGNDYFNTWIYIVTKSSNDTVYKKIQSYCKSLKITYDDQTRKVVVECFTEKNFNGESIALEHTLTEDDLTKTYGDDKYIKIHHGAASYWNRWLINYPTLTWSDNDGIENYCIDVPRWNKFVEENPSYPIQ